MSKVRKSRGNTKREQFIKAAEKPKWQGALRWIIPLAILLTLIIVGFFWLNRNSDQEKPSLIEMTDIQADVEDGKIVFPLSEIKGNKLVYFEYKGSTTIPLLAYIGPSGKVITAVSVCEPCKGERFSIEGETLVCNTCGTVWKLETHEGISGGCPQFPPEIIPNQVSKDKVLINKDSVEEWKPRANKINDKRA